MGKHASVYTYTGKFGEGVGYKNIMGYLNRKYVADVSNPKTKRQNLVRARFARLGILSRHFHVSQIGLAKQAYDQRTYAPSLFVKMNWAAVTAVTPDEVTINYSALKIADGTVPQVTFGVPDFETEGSVSVTWTPATGVSGMNNDDKVFVFIYQPDTGQSVLSAYQRVSDRSITVEVPSVWSGMRVHVYGFVLHGDLVTEGVTVREMITSARDCDCSPSTYVGTGDIA